MVSINPPPPDLEQELERRFGFRAFRPGQRTLVQAALAGRDALGVMPTGGGKSLCFQLPAAVRDSLTLVVSPLIALMKDQVTALQARGIAAEYYNSSQDGFERRRVESALATGRVRLLYIAPERIQQAAFMELLARQDVSLLAIDEAHCISHWGHDFRPDYRRLGELRKLLPGGRVPVMALTATATERVQQDIVERLHMEAPVRVITGFRRPGLAFEVRRCSSRAEKLGTLQELIAEALDQGGSAVIYAATRKNVEKVSAELGGRGLRAQVAHYHAGLTDEERDRAQEQFLSGERRVLVATNAFGMGIDKRDVRLVAHFDIPGSVEAYYQEAGRAGRDGNPARCVLLFNHADVATQEFFISQSEGENAENQQALLKQLVRYAYATGACRQGLILGYFGDEEARGFEGCGRCDACCPRQRVLRQADELTALGARQALAAVARLSGRFGKGRIAELLKGSQAASFLATGLQGQSTYGLLDSWTQDEIRSLLDQLLEDGYLAISGLEYPVLGISAQGVRAMKGEIPMELSREAGPAAPRASRAAPG
jgi:ATP-dependent DNA helicase RecQ